METEAIAVKQVHKAYGQQQVLKGIDLSVGAGEILSVLGKSGTGKSVLLRLLIGLQKPDSGSVVIAGQEITGLDREALNTVRRQIGFLFQEAALYDSLTIGQNVEFPLQRNTTLNQGDRIAKVHELLTSVGLDEHIDKLPSDISGGMRKRAGIARALALDPQIVLFDEPTAGLDPITAAEIGRLIQTIRDERNTTSVVVTHDMHAAHFFSDRLVMLKEGGILAAGTYDELCENQDPFVKQFLSDAA
ncbi:MAG: ATP-binding cassette domain-containing protein [Acidobacteriota bacterium]